MVRGECGERRVWCQVRNTCIARILKRPATSTGSWKNPSTNTDTRDALAPGTERRPRSILCVCVGVGSE